MKELCVRCGKETKYDTSTPITLRRYFIEGAGQLCSNCWAKLWPTREEKETEKHHDNCTICGDA
jgi:DNA-directed RNA polymerase subunit RPC12/RpoP